MMELDELSFCVLVFTARDPHLCHRRLLSPGNGMRPIHEMVQRPVFGLPFDLGRELVAGELHRMVRGSGSGCVGCHCVMGDNRRRPTLWVLLV